MNNLMASIDVGAHSARMLIVEVSNNGSEYDAIEDLEYPVPLGADVFKTGSISEKSVNILCGILGNFRRKLGEYQINDCRAIATSAVREAANADVFLDRVFFHTGIKLKIFSGGDEARLCHLAVIPELPRAFQFAEKRVLLADIGTGASQISFYDRGRMRFTETVRLGTLRASVPETAAPELRIEAFQPMIDAAFGEMEYLSRSLDSDSLILTGGSVRAMFEMASRKKIKKGIVSIPVEDFVRIAETAKRESVERLCGTCGLRPDIAEAVLPCSMIVENLCKLTGAKTILAPAVSTKYALVEDYINENVNKFDPFEDQIYALSLLTAERYGGDSALLEKTAVFAETLFDKLEPLHGLPHRSMVLLKVAAYLHKTGLFVSNQAYHKHSFYLISNMEIPGLSLEERRVVALLARYHRKALPRIQHPEYAPLSAEDRALVNKLAAILRIACGLAAAWSAPSAMTVKREADLITVRLRGTPKQNTALPIDTSLFNYAFASKIIFPQVQNHD